MKKIEALLKEIWQNRIRPALALYDDNPDLEKVSAQIDNLHLKISNMLVDDEELFDLFNKYELLHGKCASIMSERAFIEGFKYSSIPSYLNSLNDE